jgi:hypothetical protein
LERSLVCVLAVVRGDTLPPRSRDALRSVAGGLATRERFPHAESISEPPGRRSRHRPDASAVISSRRNTAAYLRDIEIDPRKYYLEGVYGDPVMKLPDPTKIKT